MNDPIQELFQRLEELERRVSQMVVRGKIKEVDAAKALAKVEYGKGLATGWLPWKPIRTGKAIVWWMPEVGEGVTVISEGDLVLGEIFPGSYHAGFKAPSDDPDLFLVQFGDGSEISHNRSNGTLTVINKGDINVTTDKNLTVNANNNVNVICENATVDATKTTINSETEINGNTTIKGNANISGICAVGGLAAVGGGAVPAKGGMEMTGGDVVVDGVSSTKHTHKENGTGGGVTDIPQ